MPIRFPHRSNRCVVSPLKKGVRFGMWRGEKVRPPAAISFGQLLQQGKFADLIEQ
jgi:hypothetical protein